MFCGGDEIEDFRDASLEGFGVSGLFADLRDAGLEDYGVAGLEGFGVSGILAGDAGLEDFRASCLFVYDLLGFEGTAFSSTKSINSTICEGLYAVFACVSCITSLSAG